MGEFRELVQGVLLTAADTVPVWSQWAAFGLAASVVGLALMAWDAHHE